MKKVSWNISGRGKGNIKVEELESLLIESGRIGSSITINGKSQQLVGTAFGVPLYFNGEASINYITLEIGDEKGVFRVDPYKNKIQVISSGGSRSLI